MIDFHLSENDKSTALWLRLKAHMEGRLAAARVRNDGALTEAETAALRGEIKTLKALTRLDLARPMTGDDE